MGQLDPVPPRYGQASLAEVMPSVLSVLGMPYERDALGLGPALQGVRRVAVVLLDGLGWHQLGIAAPHAPTLTDVIGGRLGTARSITSGFPSTTPVSLVTLGTGAPPGSHGIVGITLNQPGTDKIVNHLHWDDQPDPASWQPLPTAFTRAANAGIVATVVSNPAFERSGLSVSAYRGARFGAGILADAVASEMLAAFATSQLVYGYLPDVDRAGHDHGIGTGEWRAAVSSADRLLTRLIDGLPPDSALVVTADHGQLDIPLDRRLDLDLDPRLREGVAVVAGEPRVRYLHVIPGALDDVIASWRGVLGDGAWVVSREEAVASGWFGPIPQQHLARIGDVVVACRERWVVMASAHEPARLSRMVAFHGSSTAAEMQIPLLVIRR
ncbi:alkaline phosphatase family protein [Dactylosporangium sucinum]|uniref:Alkaline phosphatase family protein n=1 Tax=Dactylosporangium sucinum TaxID=1424081 RepID=A0A917UF98_9ACTN|nr:nucleotide pyrophosphatase/phosphodiesterase family protein [Dactylosporangium sucinum]GGM85203.1 alkaline phosphatase family protein [Dactylosporangium sucinum]